MSEEGLDLGGHINLKGFSDRDYAELIVVKKLVGRYVRQLTDHGHEPQQLSITLKQGNLIELQVRCVTADKDVAAHAEDKNLFIALDAALKRVATQIH